MKRTRTDRVLLAVSVPTVGFALNQTALSVPWKVGIYAAYVCLFIAVLVYYRKR